MAYLTDLLQTLAPPGESPLPLHTEGIATARNIKSHTGARATKIVSVIVLLSEHPHTSVARGKLNGQCRTAANKSDRFSEQALHISAGTSQDKIRYLTPRVVTSQVSFTVRICLLALSARLITQTAVGVVNELGGVSKTETSKTETPKIFSTIQRIRLIIAFT